MPNQASEPLTIKPSKKIREMSGHINGYFATNNNNLENKDSNFLKIVNFKSLKLAKKGEDDVRSVTENR